MALRSFWMAAWLMVVLKTQTFGPKAATFASGQIDEGSCRVMTPAAAPDGTAASQAPATSAAAANRARLGRQRRTRPLVIVFTPRPASGRGPDPDGMASRMMAPSLSGPVGRLSVSIARA